MLEPGVLRRPEVVVPRNQSVRVRVYALPPWCGHACDSARRCAEDSFWMALAGTELTTSVRTPRDLRFLRTGARHALLTFVHLVDMQRELRHGDGARDRLAQAVDAERPRVHVGQRLVAEGPGAGAGGVVVAGVAAAIGEHRLQRRRRGIPPRARRECGAARGARAKGPMYARPEQLSS